MSSEPTYYFPCPCKVFIVIFPTIQRRIQSFSPKMGAVLQHYIFKVVENWRGHNLITTHKMGFSKQDRTHLSYLIMQL